MVVSCIVAQDQKEATTCSEIAGMLHRLIWSSSFSRSNEIKMELTAYPGRRLIERISSITDSIRSNERGTGQHLQHLRLLTLIRALDSLAACTLRLGRFLSSVPVPI